MVALIAVITATATENRETHVEPLAEYLYQWFICSSTRFPCPAQFLIRHQHYFSKSLVYSLYLLPPRGSFHLISSASPFDQVASDRLTDCCPERIAADDQETVNAVGRAAVCLALVFRFSLSDDGSVAPNEVAAATVARARQQPPHRQQNAILIGFCLYADS